MGYEPYDAVRERKRRHAERAAARGAEREALAATEGGAPAASGDGAGQPSPAQDAVTVPDPSATPTSDTAGDTAPKLDDLPLEERADGKSRGTKRRG